MVATRTFECLACASSLEFNAGSMSTRCGMCEDARPLPLRFAPDVVDVPVRAGAPGADLGDRTLVQCAGCGARVSGAAAPATCPMCGATVRPPTEAVLTATQGYLPFLLDANAAAAMLRTELSRVGLGAQVPELRKMYVPWMLASCVVEARYQGRRGTATADGERTRIEWQDVEGSAERHWDNMHGCASAALPAEVGRRLEPWDWAFAERYTPAAIEDVTAEHTAIRLEDIFNHVHPYYVSDVERAAMDDIGGDRQEVLGLDEKRRDERTRIVLLPVWVGRVGTDWVAVNGRTGAAVVQNHAAGRSAEGDRELRPDPARTGRLIVMLAIAATITGLLLWAQSS